jgi:hypothetical protein
MNKKCIPIIISLVFFSFLVLPLASANVIVFDEYVTGYTVKGNSLIVEKSLRLTNVGDGPIIPGEIHFKVSTDGLKGAPEVENYNAINNRDGSDLDTQLIKNADQTSLIFTVWEPLLPGFFVDVQMTYEMDFKPKGLLFYSVSLPQEETTIPINQYGSEVILPRRFHITYAPNGEVIRGDDGFKAVNLFWIIIMLIFVVQLFLKVRKLRRL